VRPPAAGRRPAAYPSAAAGCPPAAGQPPEAGHPCAAVHPPVAGHLSPAGLHLGLRDAGREQLEGLRRAHTDGADRGDNSAVGVMGASKDPVWEFFTPGTRPKSFKCKFCQLELYGNPTVLKRHMVGSKCNPPAEVRRVLLQKLVSNKRKAGDGRLEADLADLEADSVTAASHSKSARKGLPVSSTGARSTSTTGPLSSFVKVLTQKQVEALDSMCAKWICRNALPLSTTESSSFRAFARALKPAYKPLSRWSLAGPLLDKDFKELSLLVESFIKRCVRDGTVVIGGDGWSDRLMNSVYNMLLFVPQPLYVETKVCGESRHTAENTAAFFAERINSLGPRNVCAFVSDTENKMKAVWDLLQTRYPWIVIIPCAAHCLDLLFADICKHSCVSRPLAFCSSMTRYWRLHGFPKAVLERCQKTEYGCVRQLQRPGATRWKSQLSAVAALLNTQSAMEKAVVETTFKEECLLKRSVEQRKVAAEAAQAVKRDVNWEELGIVVKLLQLSVCTSIYTTLTTLHPASSCCSSNTSFCRCGSANVHPPPCAHPRLHPRFAICRPRGPGRRRRDVGRFWSSQVVGRCTRRQACYERARS